MSKNISIAEKLKKKYYKSPYISDLKDLLYRSAKRFKRRNAFKVKDNNGNIYGITYEQYKNDVEALGTSLLELGLKGKAIAVIGKNSYKWAVSYMAACIVGIVVPIDKELLNDDVINFMNISETKVILGDDKNLSSLLENSSKINSPTIFVNFDIDTDKSDTILSFENFKSLGKKLVDNGSTTFEDITIDPNELRFLLFTSGTTGSAKGVCLSHKNIASNIMSTYGIIKLKHSDQVLSILPIHHTFECTLGYLLVMYIGGCVAYCDGLKYISNNISEYRPTIVLCVPLLLENVLKKINKALEKSIPEKYKKNNEVDMDNLPFIVRKVAKMKIKNSLGGRLHTFIVGAAAIRPEVVESFFKLGIRTLQGYGLTECSPLVAGNNQFYQKYDSVGLPIPDVEYKINNPDENGIGEIIVKGPNVMLGYFKDAKETNKVIRDGWFHTGDLGKIDENGYLYITGRLKSVIITKNGKNVYPEEIEYYLNNNPLISESLVLGMHNDSDNDTYVNAQIFPNIDAIKEKLKVSIIHREEIYAIVSDIIKDINKKLPNYKHIKKFIIRDQEFEKTTTKKIKRYGKNMDVDK